MTRQGPVDEPTSARTGARDGFPCLTENDVLEYLRRAPSASVDTAVQKHLDACAVCRMLVAEAARTTLTAGGSQSSGPSAAGDLPQTLSVGEVIMDRYEIIRFAARGGMGEVYEARDSILKEVVALKTLVCTALDDPRAVSRLLDEVRLARQVTHPNVCRIFEFGLHRPKGAADPIPFLTMEFLRSETLDQRIMREGKLSPAYVAMLLPQIVAGLSAIHAAGIVHRDIKPQNMFLLPGPPERLVLTDFGVARGLEGSPSGQSATGPVIVGTLDYMAPEQLEGKPPSPSFDIYARGVVIFEMITGRRPFSGPNALASVVERFRRPPPRPSELVPTLDPIWDKLVAGCMAPDPNHRFSRAEDLLEPALKLPQPRGARRWLEPRFLFPALAVIAAAGMLANFTRRANSKAGSRGSVQADGGMDLTAAGVANANSPGECAEEASFPYVVSASYNTLYRFDPAQLKFTKLGMIKCPTGASVNAMTVDRGGSLWVNYLDDGKIYKVNPKTLACEPTAYVAGGGIGFSTALSMQFLQEGAGSQALYVSDHTGDAKNELTGKGLGRIDPATMRLTAVGPFTGELSGHRCELSGARDGHLYGFFEGNPAVLAEIDTKTGATPNPRALAGVNTNGAYAFSLWGGLFWLYTTLPAPDHTKVTRFDPKSGETKIVIPSVGFQIVGAGVSSCAPSEMPRAARAVVQITAGAQHNCVLFSDGNVRCWGDNGHGQLGYGHTRPIGIEETPASVGDVQVGGPVRQISAGDFHTCAVLETGKVRCWGNGSQGQLGYGNTNDVGDDELPFAAGDVDVGGPVRAVSAGGPHTCAVLETGKVRCWGRGDGGHLGYGNKASIGDDESPASAGDVDVGGGPVRAVVAGSHTCALLENGNVRCWAGGSDGRLGYGNLKNIGKEEPPSSAGDIKLGGKARQIAMGQFHTCALLDTGKIRCWGSGSVGQLGYDGNENIGDNETPASAGDVNVGGTVRQIAAGGNDTCALLTNARVRCWGQRSGQLAAGSGFVDVGAGVRQIAMGTGHTCLLLDTGKVRCWGENHHGQLGAGHPTSEPASAPIEDVALP